MKHSIIILALAAICLQAGAQKEQTYEMKDVFFIGIATSYIDSIVYLTDIQPLADIAMDTDTKQPLNIEMYTQQLNQYFKDIQANTFVCTTYAREKRKDIEKLYLKLRKKYGKKDGFEIRELAPGTWTYEAVDPTTVYRHIIDETVSGYIPDEQDMPERRDGGGKDERPEGEPPGGGGQPPRLE